MLLVDASKASKNENLQPCQFGLYFHLLFPPPPHQERYLGRPVQISFTHLSIPYKKDVHHNHEALQ
jgi:hypothetical protein